MTEWFISIKRSVKSYKCKAKVFTQMSGNLSEKIGSPDLLILFTNTVSHKMVHCAVTEAEKCNAQIVRCHTSSGNALNEILQNSLYGISIWNVGQLIPDESFIKLHEQIIVKII